MRNIFIRDNKLCFKSEYDLKIVNYIRNNFQDKKWIPDQKIWTAPIIAENVENIEGLISGFGFIADAATKIEVEKHIADAKIEAEKANINVPDVTIPSNISYQLYSFQKVGVNLINHFKGRVLLSDEMGLGKTIQAITYSQLYPQEIPILVVCPAILKINWLREFKNCSGVTGHIINSENGMKIPTTYKLYIINYDIVSKYQDFIDKMNFKIIILDECHYLKNHKAIRTKTVMELSKKIPKVLAITGTPILNRPIEMFNILSLLSPNKFGNWFEYAQRYCGMKKTKFGYDVSGATHIPELAEKLRRVCMIRREKKEVLTDLPDKLRQVIPIECNLEVYKEAEDNFTSYLIEMRNKSRDEAFRVSQVEMLAKIEYLKQEAVKAKFTQFAGWVKDFLDENDKLVIFAHHKESITNLIEELKDYKPVSITGGQSNDDRQQVIDKFQNDKSCKVIICSIKAAGIGITLTASSYVAFLELAWTPSEMNQCEDRCHRIGVKSNVTCYYFIANNTIEQVIYDLIQKKQGLFMQLMQDKHTVMELDSMSIMEELTNNMVNKNE